MLCANNKLIKAADVVVVGTHVNKQVYSLALLDRGFWKVKYICFKSKGTTCSFHLVDNEGSCDSVSDNSEARGDFLVPRTTRQLLCPAPLFSSILRRFHVRHFITFSKTNSNTYCSNQNSIAN